MNSNRIRTSAAVIVAIAATGAGLAASPADASTAAPSKVTAKATDNMPASGQTFRVRGAVESQGQGTPATIVVKTLRNGTWVPLAGASMHTDRSGRYTIRLVLETKGERQLRVVADPDAGAIRTSRTTFSVSVGMPGNSTCD
jgi:hypothetical protein